MKYHYITKKLDHLGMGVSFVCAIHCAVLPVLVGVLPLIGLELLAHPVFETAIIITSLIIGATAILRAWKRHHKPQPAFIMLIGFTLILAGRFLADESHEWLFLSVGGITVAVSHYFNWLLDRSCHHQHK